MSRTITWLLAASIASVIIVACSGAPATFVPPADGTAGSPGGNQGQPGQVASSLDSCAVLSDAEIEAATGESVVERKTSALRPDVFPSICDIELDGGGSLTVSVRASGGRSMYENSFEPFIGQDSYLEEAVDGLGDKAGRAGNDTLMVLKDDVLFDIQFIEFGRRDRLTVVRYLAEVILAKLPCIAAGCPGFTPPSPPPAAEAVDVCALLTNDELEDATGFPVSAGEPAGGIGHDTRCTWTVNDDPDFPGVHWIEIEVRSSGGREQFDFLAEEMYAEPPEHVPGLGDDAVKTGTVPGGYVHAVVGDRLVSLHFSLPGSVDDPYALVVPLMGTALSRL